MSRSPVLEIQRMKSSFEANNPGATLTGIELDADAFDEFEKQLHDEIRCFPHLYEQRLHDVRGLTRGMPTVLEVCGVTIRKREREVPAHVLDAWLRARRIAEGLRMEARDAVVEVYRAMRDAEERGR